MKTKSSGQMSLRFWHMLQMFFFFFCFQVSNYIFLITISYIIKYDKDSILHAMLSSCLL